MDNIINVPEQEQQMGFGVRTSQSRHNVNMNATCRDHLETRQRGQLLGFQRAVPTLQRRQKQRFRKGQPGLKSGRRAASCPQSRRRLPRVRIRSGLPARSDGRSFSTRGQESVSPPWPAHLRPDPARSSI